MKSRFPAFSALCAAVLMLIACEDPMVAGGSSSTETGTPIKITGRVVGNNGQVLSGVVVRLKENGASDTTDAAGVYSILGKIEANPDTARDVLDTLLFLHADQRITAVSITGWTQVVPDIQIIQRGFLGYLHTHGKTVGRVAGVLTGGNVTPGDSLTATFYHNAVSENYSGFLYFPSPGDSIRTYQVRVKIYGVDGALLGTSQTVGFTSQAGNILVPDLDL